jgi:hypothetical protein
VTDPGGSDVSASSFFFGSTGLELVNVDDVAFRIQLDAGCHLPYADASCQFTSGLTLTLAFKDIAFLGPQPPDEQ